MNDLEMPDVSFALPALDRALPAEIKIRCDKPFKDKITANAKALNLTTSDYIRLCCDLNIAFTDQITEETRPQDVVLVDRVTYPLLIAQIKRIGNNINQMSRALNILARFINQLNKKQSKYPEFVAAINKIRDSYPSFTGEFIELSAQIKKLQEMKTYELAKLPKPKNKRG